MSPTSEQIEAAARRQDVERFTAAKDDERVMAEFVERMTGIESALAECVRHFNDLAEWARNLGEELRSEKAQQWERIVLSMLRRRERHERDQD